jgi:urease accessory protein UreF
MQLKNLLQKGFLPLSLAQSALKSAKAGERIFAGKEMKPSQKNIASMEAENLLGDFHPLIDQLGTADGLQLAGEVNAALRLDLVKDLAGLKTFLETYRAQLLAPVELPLICAAYFHASRNEFSELLLLDQQVARDSHFEVFSAASKRVGDLQLKRLRPLRDQRGLQRYIRAVEAGQAHAWHTLVYGITLASFSLPLRQGLQNYAQQTLRGFVRAAANAHRLAEQDCENLLSEIGAAIPGMIDGLLADSFSPAVSSR